MQIHPTRADKQSYSALEAMTTSSSPLQKVIGLDPPARDGHKRT